MKRDLRQTNRHKTVNQTYPIHVNEDRQTQTHTRYNNLTYIPATKAAATATPTTVPILTLPSAVPEPSGHDVPEQPSEGLTGFTPEEIPGPETGVVFGAGVGGGGIWWCKANKSRERVQCMWLNESCKVIMTPSFDRWLPDSNNAQLKRLSSVYVYMYIYIYIYIQHLPATFFVESLTKQIRRSSLKSASAKFLMIFYTYIYIYIYIYIYSEKSLFGTHLERVWCCPFQHKHTRTHFKQMSI
jgi:hypothetical protein